MRFRLATRPPLEPLKAWFDISDDSLVVDIFGVKNQICSRLQQLVDSDGARFRPAEIVLSLDGFELLDDSSLLVIKENDLICISKSTSPLSQKKRKASVDYEPSRKKRKFYGGAPLWNHTIPAISVSSSSSEEEESSSSSSSEVEGSSASESSSSESESESESDSDSDSDSTTSSDSSVELESSKPPQKPTPVISKEKVKPVVPPTRPGEGKATTHSRNARRRAKRMHQKEQLEREQATVQALPNGSANAIPLGTQKAVDQVQTGGPANLPKLPPSPNAEQGSSFEVESMVTTLRNKNKKRGFKRTMEGLTPQRIIFSESDPTGAPPESSTSTYYSAVAVTPTTPGTETPRLVRPSEIQSQGLLPSNMFVTTVEVEGGRWDKSKKKKQRDTYGYQDEDGYVAKEVTEIQETALNYGEPEVDWDSIEQNWDKFPTLTDISTIKAGRLVGWKALAINPSTFTPETLVHLGRVKDINEASTTIVLNTVRRPGAGVIAFGANIADIADGDGDAGDETLEEEQYSFKDALESSWKLID